jgi:sporulation protein YlmC with PRC-barrel domain
LEEDMLKKHIGACLFATALTAAPALAQTTTSPAPASPPAQAPANQSAAPASSQAGSGQFMTAMKPNQWRASKLMGVDIYGFDQDNRNDRDKIGDVEEVILDRDGKIEAVVIGVGGFLGLGKKEVAIPFKSVEWRYGDQDVRTTATTPRAPAGSAPARTDVPATATAPARPADAPATGTAARTDRADMNQGYPDRGYIRMSKADLQNAPEFHYSADEAAARNTNPPPAVAQPTTPNAPRQ